jgi:hypothetical protein
MLELKHEDRQALVKLRSYKEWKVLEAIIKDKIAYNQDQLDKYDNTREKDLTLKGENEGMRRILAGVYKVTDRLIKQEEDENAKED